MTARDCDDRLSCFIPLNSPHGQPHDEARFAGFRFDFDLTAMPVAYDALADRQAETLSRTNALRGEKRFEDMREISLEIPGPLSVISTTV